MEFEYDDSGQTFTFFMLAALAIYLVPATLSRLRSRKDGESKSHVASGECMCAPCVTKRSTEEKEKPRFNVSAGDVVYGVCLVLFVYLAYQVTTYQQEKLYDPFEVLGLDHSATEKEIKAEYRKLSKQWHPDKNLGNPEAPAMFMRIAKAYEALTNEQIRKNWEEFGNPDGPGLKRFGIALPAWIVSKGNEGLVLALYACVFGLALPISVAIWWRNSRKYIKDAIMEITAKIYIQVIKTSSMPVKSLFKTLVLAKEFEVEMKVKDYDQKFLPTLLSKLDDLPNDPTKMGFGQITLGRSSVKALVLYHAHMNRLEVPEPLKKDLEYCLKKAPVLLQGLVEASALRRYLTNTINCMTMSQMLTQAVDTGLIHYPLLQIPHITNDHLRHLASKKNNIKTIQEFYQADLDVLKKDVLRMEDAEFEDVRRFGSTFPFLKVSYALKVHDADVTEEEEGKGVKVSEGDVVLCTITITRLTLDELKREKEQPNEADALTTKKAAAVVQQEKKEAKEKKDAEEQAKKDEKQKQKKLDEDEDEDEGAGGDEKTFDSEDEVEDEQWEELQKDTKKPKLSDVKKAESIPVHCPHYPFPKQEQWWVFLGDRSNGQDFLLSVPPHRLLSLKREETVDIRFQAPPMGKYNWNIFVISDSYIGADITAALKFNVGKAAELPVQHEEEEEEAVPELEEGGSSGEESEDF